MYNIGSAQTGYPSAGIALVKGEPSLNLKKLAMHQKLAAALLTLLAAFLATVSATFAWYIYNTSAHTTRVHMVAGTSVSLSISNTAEGTYSGSAKLESFTGKLNPVSTDSIAGGFQKVVGFTSSEATRSLLASAFDASTPNVDYYSTSLYLKTDGAPFDVYIAGIGYTDSSKENPISTAIRVGFRVPSTGDEAIFAINQAQNPNSTGYNTATGEVGSVLMSSETDGSTIPFTPLTSANYALVDGKVVPPNASGENDTAGGAISLQGGSTKICTASQTPTEVQVYIWLEGCDEDCTQNLRATTLQNLAISFCAYNPATTTETTRAQ